ncbi:hypothetical protein ACFPM0_29475 [Pseudonocardia sulfidoxydans]|uniref:hypothetical protein n=1 Tax=Pseudonocardia sulfidoxydans TaxID=54011 RepID=UPI00361E2251
MTVVAESQPAVEARRAGNLPGGRRFLPRCAVLPAGFVISVSRRDHLVKRGLVLQV